MDWELIEVMHSLSGGSPLPITASGLGDIYLRFLRLYSTGT